MKTALLDIKEQFNPDRIIVESSGSAFREDSILSNSRLLIELMISSRSTQLPHWRGRSESSSARLPVV